MKTAFTLLFTLCYAIIFAQAGALDPSFNDSGKYIGFNYDPIEIYLNKLTTTIVQPDGKILVGGTYINNSKNAFGQGYLKIQRFNADGSPDASFGSNQGVYINFANSAYMLRSSHDELKALALQSDGKIIVAGTSNAITTNYGVYWDSIKTYNNSDIVVVRLNSDGTLDNSFNGNGKKVVDLTKYTRNTNTISYSNDACGGVAVRNDGRIVIIGNTLNNKNVSTAYPQGDSDAVIIQLLPNGNYDSSFSKDGVQLYVKKGTNESMFGIALQSDGKAVADGTSENAVLVLRYTTTGSADPTFNGTGRKTVQISTSGSSHPSGIAIQTDGRILVGGYQESQTNNSFVFRMTTDGLLDPTFGKNGKTILVNSGPAYGMCLQKDGKIVQVGSTFGNYKNSQISSDGSTGVYQPFTGGNNFQLTRYRASGKVDSAFGTYGRSIIDLGNHQPDATKELEDVAFGCAIQADGKIIAVGKTNYNNGSIITFDAIVRVQGVNKNYGITGPDNQNVSITNCSTSFSNINPVIYPDTSLSAVKYKIYSRSAAGFYTLVDTGSGGLNGKNFGVGDNTVVYSSKIDSNQRAVFRLNITGGSGTPAGALDFDGIDDRAYFTYSGLIGDSSRYTFESWIKVKAYTIGGAVIFGNQRNNNSGVNIRMNGDGYLTTYQPNVGTVTSTYKVQLNTWTHIAYVQSPTKLDLYVNGNFVQTLLQAPNLQTATGDRFYLGTYTNDDVSFSNYFNGQFDEVRTWYGQSICQAQIQNNMNGVLNNSFNTWMQEYTMNVGLAGCVNTNLTKVSSQWYGLDIILQNFALDGPVSNFVEGHVTGTAPAFPVLQITSVPSNLTFYSSKNTCDAVANFAVNATSGCSDHVTITYSQNPGTVFPVGKTLVYANAADGTGNNAGTQFYVTVLDTINPKLTTKDTTLILASNGVVSLSPSSVISSATDNCTNQDSMVTTVSPNSFTTAGIYTVKVKVKDSSNNITSKTATVTVLPYGSNANRSSLFVDGRNITKQNEFSVSTLSNPTQDQFTLQVSSSDLSSKINIKITDLSGRILEVMSDVKPGTSKQFGSAYRAGTYIAVVSQGTNSKTIKLVKM